MSPFFGEQTYLLLTFSNVLCNYAVIYNQVLKTKGKEA